MATRAPEAADDMCTAPAAPATAMPVIRLGVFGGMIALAAMPATAADSEPLDQDFLEYLAEFEGRDDWSWFDAHEDDTGKGTRQSTPPEHSATPPKDPEPQP